MDNNININPDYILLLTALIHDDVYITCLAFLKGIDLTSNNNTIIATSLKGNFQHMLRKSLKLERPTNHTVSLPTHLTPILGAYVDSVHAVSCIRRRFIPEK